MRYMITLKWLFDLFYKLNSVYGDKIHKTKHFKYFSIISKIIIALGIIICLLIRYYKMSKLNSLEDPKDSINDNVDINDTETNDISIRDQNYLNRISEERWSGTNIIGNHKR
jgi:hypothetical protein